MPYAKIPDSDHVLRYAGQNRLQLDDSGHPLALAPAAFKLRPEDNGKLSVTWLEYFHHCGPPRGHDAVVAFRQSMSNRLGRKSAFGIANVGRLRSELGAVGKRIRILEEPTDDNPGHAVVTGYSNDEEELLELLATSVFTELLPNSEVPE